MRKNGLLLVDPWLGISRLLGWQDDQLRTEDLPRKLDTLAKHRIHDMPVHANKQGKN